jgi:alpha-beta hydrolase superfamily lysophospholipase
MSTTAARKTIRSTLRWILWVLLAQFILINISASLYAYKLTHFYDATAVTKNSSPNVFEKTWKLFTGPKYHKIPVVDLPNRPYEMVYFHTSRKDRIEAWYMKADSAKGTVILFHGLTSNKVAMLAEAYEFLYMGYNVLLPDLRAHGNSSGNTTALGVWESEEVKLSYDFISSQGEQNIILYGISMGAVIIAKSIYDYGIKPSHIILDAPFNSLTDHLRGRARELGFPTEPFATLFTFWISIERGFNGFRHNTSDYATKINCPALVQYGDIDRLVLRKEPLSIFDHIPSSQKKFVEYPSADHESFLLKDPATWRKTMEDFLR